MGIVTDGRGNPVRDGNGNPVRSGGRQTSQQRGAGNSSNPSAGGSATTGSELTPNQALQRVGDFANATGFGSLLRAANLLRDAEPENPTQVSATVKNAGSDWRVKLSLPNNYQRLAAQSPYVLDPLIDTGGLVFPYTPTIYMTHSTSYSPVQPVHSNYPFFAYQNSRVDQFSIVGDFYVENNVEGLYWIAAVHYLRSVSKMAYGQTSDQGSPPPVVKLNGYGDYVFKDVPVVITSFSIELGQDIDYIQVPGFGGEGSWVPTRSNIQATVQPIYSRREVEKFSLDQFVKGGYIPKGGFI